MESKALTAMRGHLAKAKMYKYLSKDERTKYIEELIKSGYGTALIDQLVQCEVEEELSPEDMIFAGFPLEESKYGKSYWESVADKIKDNRTTVSAHPINVISNEEDLSSSIIDAMAFEKMQKIIEEGVQHIGYRRKSLHANDKHTWCSRDRVSFVSMQDGYLSVESTNVKMHTILYKWIKLVRVFENEVLVILRNGIVIVIK